MMPDLIQQSHPLFVAQKLQLTYKLLLLENARNSLVDDLHIFTNEACEDVQSFLNSSFPPSVFSDLTKALDEKRQTIIKLSALLKDLTVEPQCHVQATVQNAYRTNQLQPLRDRQSLMTDVLKFGPMLHNILMATSITKAVQVLGASLSLQQLQRFLVFQPAVIQNNNTVCSFSAIDDSQAEEKRAAVPEETLQPDAVIVPPVVIESRACNAENPKLPPPTEAKLPETSNPELVKMAPLINWGYENDVEVRHQKQTTSQLLQFLKAQVKNVGPMEVICMDFCKSHTCAAGFSQPAAATVKTQSCHLGHGVANDVRDINVLGPKTLLADVESLVPVFREKRIESSGSLIYACVIATKTELWDIGDVYTEVEGCPSETNPLENDDDGDDGNNQKGQVEKSSVNIQWKTENLQSAEPEQKHISAGAETAVTSTPTIPEFQNRRFDEIEVVVCHVISPDNFYIQHADSVMKLQDLVTDSCKAGSSYAEQNCIPDIGTKVMGWFPKQEQWCRAQVTKICGISEDFNATAGTGSEVSIKVEVKRLDYGDTGCLSLRNLKELTPEMAVLPLQALQVSLANVMPVNGSDWSEEALAWFRDMVRNRTLYARLYPQGPKITVELFLEKGKLGAMRRGASLSLRLAQNGHAKHDKLKNVGLMKSIAQLKRKKLESDWERYIISCYTQNKKTF